MRISPTGRAVCAAVLFAALTPAGAAPAVALVNPFHDPFAQVTHTLPGCPVPSPPTYTPAEMHEVEHHRVERGNSCYLAGKCRYSNSFLYDKGIARGLFPALGAEPALRGTSLWVLVQGRLAQVFGCVSRPAQTSEIERLVREWPDVQAEVADVMVGTRARPPYATAGSGTAR